MKKLGFIGKVIVAFFLGALSFKAKAQEGLYQFNYLNYNPAYAGSENNLAIIPFHFFNLYSARRDSAYFQSSGSYIGSVEMRVNKINSAFGYQYNQAKYSFFQTYSHRFMYNYEIKLKDKIKLRLGTQLSRTTENYTRTESVYYAIDFGTWLNAGDFYAGISTVNLLPPPTQNSFTGSLIHVIAGYKFEIKNLSFTPSALYTVGNRNQNILDINGIFSYKRQFYLGGSYRFYGENQIPGIIVGLELFKKIQLMGSCNFRKIQYSSISNISEFGFLIKYKIGLDKK
jgi:hypothetical protein